MACTSGAVLAWALPAAHRPRRARRCKGAQAGQMPPQPGLGCPCRWDGCQRPSMLIPVFTCSTPTAGPCQRIRFGGWIGGRVGGRRGRAAGRAAGRAWGWVAGWVVGGQTCGQAHGCMSQGRVSAWAGWLNSCQGLGSTCAPQPGSADAHPQQQKGDGSLRVQVSAALQSAPLHGCTSCSGTYAAPQGVAFHPGHFQALGLVERLGHEERA